MMRSITLSLAAASVIALACSDNENPNFEGRPRTGAGGADACVGGAAGDAGSSMTGGAGSGGTEQGGTAGAAGGDAGGTGGSGGSAGSGGSGSKALPGGKHGSFPETATVDDAEQAYESWKEDYVEDCGGNGVRVIGNVPEETYSEGIGFGALLSVAWDDQKTFDGLWRFYKKAAGVADVLNNTKNGLMGWFVGIDPCELGEVYPGTSSGADLNMAMALLQAECRWGGGKYLEDATELITSIRTAVTVEVEGRIVLLPSANMGSDIACSSPSYYSPGYYRVFAKAFPDDAKFWNTAADDSYALLALASDNATHLTPDWTANSSKVCASENGYVGYDGIRTIWRVATDYNWFGADAAKAWLDDVNGYMNEEVGADQLLDIKDGFFADGTGMMTTPGLGNSVFVGAFAVGSLAGNQAMSDDFHEQFINIPKSNDNSYSTATMRAIYLLLSTNQFSPGCY